MPGASISPSPIHGFSASGLASAANCSGKPELCQQQPVLQHQRSTARSCRRHAVERSARRDAGITRSIIRAIALNPALGTASLPIQQAAQAGSYWVSSIGNGLTYSTLDNAKMPTSGIRAQSNNDFAGLGGATKFARTTEDVRYLSPDRRRRGRHGAGAERLRRRRGAASNCRCSTASSAARSWCAALRPTALGRATSRRARPWIISAATSIGPRSAELQAPVPLVPPDAQLKVALFSDVGSLWATSASSVSNLSSLSPSQQIANSHAIRVLGRRQPDLGFDVRPDPGRLRLSVRQADLRCHPASAIQRRRILIRRSACPSPLASPTALY